MRIELAGFQPSYDVDSYSDGIDFPIEGESFFEGEGPLPLLGGQQFDPTVMYDAQSFQPYPVLTNEDEDLYDEQYYTDPFEVDPEYYEPSEIPNLDPQTPMAFAMKQIPESKMNAYIRQYLKGAQQKNVQISPQGKAAQKVPESVDLMAIAASMQWDPKSLYQMIVADIQHNHGDNVRRALAEHKKPGTGYPTKIAAYPDYISGLAIWTPTDWKIDVGLTEALWKGSQWALNTLHGTLANLDKNYYQKVVQMINKPYTYVVMEYIGPQMMRDTPIIGGIISLFLRAGFKTVVEIWDHILYWNTVSNDVLLANINKCTQSLYWAFSQKNMQSEAEFVGGMLDTNVQIDGFNPAEFFEGMRGQDPYEALLRKFMQNNQQQQQAGGIMLGGTGDIIYGDTEEREEEDEFDDEWF